MNSLLCILKRCKYHVCQSSFFPLLKANSKKIAKNNWDGVSERAMQGHKLDFVIVVEFQAEAKFVSGGGRDIYVFETSGDYLDLKDTKIVSSYHFIDRRDQIKAEKAEANKNN